MKQDTKATVRLNAHEMKSLGPIMFKTQLWVCDFVVTVVGLLPSWTTLPFPQAFLFTLSSVLGGHHLSRPISSTKLWGRLHSHHCSGKEAQAGKSQFADLRSSPGKSFTVMKTFQWPLKMPVWKEIEASHDLPAPPCQPVTAPAWKQIFQLQSLLMTAALLVSQLSLMGCPGLEEPSLAVSGFKTHTNKIKPWAFGAGALTPRP